jgi:hypothetical protein
MSVFYELREKNIVKAIVSFDGGNDDGGVGGILYFMEDGTKKEIDYDPQWEEGGNDTLEYRLVKDVYLNYSFNGEPSVIGTLTYDVVKEETDWDVDEYYEDEEDEDYENDYELVDDDDDEDDDEDDDDDY